MKKALALFAFVACVMFSYAQLTESQITVSRNEDLPRTDWYGFTSNSTSAFIFNSGAEYLLRVLTNQLGDYIHFITKVAFMHFTSESFSNYNGEPFNNETYYIRFYTGTHYVSTTYLDSNNVEHPYDSLVPGILAYEFPYTPTGTGVQTVHLPEPFQVPITNPCDWNEEFCVSIYAPNKSACGLCPADTNCIELTYALMDSTLGWRHYQFGNGGTYLDKPWFLAIYVEDNGYQQPWSDWQAVIYDPNDEQPDPEPVSEVFVNPSSDSLPAYFGANCLYHHLSVTSPYKLSLYVDGETPLYFLNEQTYYFEDTNDYDYYYDYYGDDDMLSFRFSENLCAMNELENLNLSFPFDLCFHIDIESLLENSCHHDVNMENNTFCARYDLQNGVHEATNTLNVYPNPACNYINVENAAGAQISIYNIAGQEVMAIEAANANESINVANLTEGVYVVRVVNGNEVATSKISIVR